MSEEMQLEVYRAAWRFYELAPWRWMDNSQLFGVADPEGGRIGYCTVMGLLGEFMALGVYLGPEGYAVLRDIFAGKLGEGNPDTAYQQLCLMASFEDRDDLEDRDRRQIKAAGLKPRGHNVWPKLRSHRPGYYPWFLDPQETVFLSAALDWATEMGRRLKVEPEFLNPSQPGQILVGLPERAGSGWTWREEWQPIPAAPVPPAPEKLTLDVARLGQMAENLERYSNVWELDAFFSPVVIREGERPYYPRLMIVIDRASKMALDFHLAGPSQGADVFAGRLIALFEKMKGLPAEIRVSRPEVLGWVGQIGEALGIPVRQMPRLPNLERARQEMLDYLDSSGMH